MKTLNLEQMEKMKGGMPCGVSLGFYGAALIGSALATGGLSLIFGVVGMGASIWGVIESCEYQLS